MKKDYKKWHNKKTYLNNDKKRVFFHEREIWFAYVGENIGYEQDGSSKDFMRPIIILKKFNNQILWGLPLTKGSKKEKPYYYSFVFKSGIKSVAILSQIKLIDAKRLRYKTGDIKEDEFDTLKEKIRRLLA